MSRCIGIPARAGRLIALLCVLCVFSRLLLIFNVKSALAAASAAVESCCPLAVGAGFVVSCQGFPDGRAARLAATSTMSGVVDRSSSDDFVRGCHVGSSLFWLFCSALGFTA